MTDHPTPDDKAGPALNADVPHAASDRPLSEAARRALLEAAAVCGVEFRPDTLAPILGRDVLSVAEALLNANRPVPLMVVGVEHSSLVMDEPTPASVSMKTS